MALKGKPSTAHVYRGSGACLYCGMYKIAVDTFSHVCTKEREDAEDERVNAKLAVVKDEWLQHYSLSGGK